MRSKDELVCLHEVGSNVTQINWDMKILWVKTYLGEKLGILGQRGLRFDFLRKNMERSNDLAVQPSVFRFWRGIFVQSLTV